MKSQNSDKNFTLSPDAPRVVAPISQESSLGAIATMPHLEDFCDIVEFRIDSLIPLPPAEIAAAITACPLPRLLTARHPDEGGAGNLSAAMRRSLYHAHLEQCQLIDLEIRSLEDLEDVVTAAHESGVLVVASVHNFHGMISLAQLREHAQRAADAGAAVFKFAVTPESETDVAALVDFLQSPAPTLLAGMGMGEYGTPSRLACAHAGSVLNYGYLDHPNAPGQCSAKELKQALL